MEKFEDEEKRSNVYAKKDFLIRLYCKTGENAAHQVNIIQNTPETFKGNTVSFQLSSRNLIFVQIVIANPL